MGIRGAEMAAQMVTLAEFMEQKDRDMPLKLHDAFEEAPPRGNVSDEGEKELVLKRYTRYDLAKRN